MVPLSHTLLRTFHSNCCQCTVFEIWNKQKKRFLDFFTAIKCICYPLWAFRVNEWQISQPFQILQLVKSLSFHIPEAWCVPRWAEPSRIGHYRDRIEPQRMQLLALSWRENDDQEIAGFRWETKVAKLFQYSFSATVPIFFNRLKGGFLLARSL